MTRAVFVDRTPELRQIMQDQDLRVPEGVYINDGSPTEAELPGLCASADVILTEHTAVPPSVLDACPAVRAIIFMGTGAGTYVDLEDAKARGITVLTTPGYGTQAVAEHTMALTFAGARKVAAMDRSVRAGQWEPLGGLQLRGSKVAVIGLGGIGQCYADMAQALGMTVMGWNRSPQDHPAYCADLDAVLRDADVVSLHLMLTDETRGLLDARRLALPRAGFLLVNTARADLVDEAALLAGLDSGQVGHAALDVFAQEPLADDAPYRHLDTVTMTAHAAYMTDEAYKELWSRTMAALDQIGGL